MRIKVLQTNHRLRVNQGEEYEAEQYELDPGKITLLSRIPDGYDPCCNLYIDEIEVIKPGDK